VKTPVKDEGLQNRHKFILQAIQAGSTQSLVFSIFPKG